MLKKIKIMTVLGTRPEIIRLSCVLPLLDEHCDHVLVHTGQNYDHRLNQVFFDDLGLRTPDFYLNCSHNSQSTADTIANIISSVDKVIKTVNPDALLVLGDTNSCLSAISAKLNKVPIFHIEAGNRCFDQRVPEETNRKIVDHVSDINLTYSAIAREYLINEGFTPDRVINIGSPLREVVNKNLNKVNNSDILNQLGVKKESFFLVSVHRHENVEPEGAFQKFTNILNKIGQAYRLPIIVSTHPRTFKRIEEADIIFDEDIRLLPPFSYSDYVKLQCEARAVISDSGTISEESSILNFPAINLREAHERPEAMEEGAVMMSGLDVENVLRCLKLLEFQKRRGLRDLSLVKDYSSINFSAKVLRIIYSYIDYVNRNVWKEIER